MRAREGGPAISIDDSPEEVQKRGQMRMLLAEQRLRSAMGSIAKGVGDRGSAGSGYARVGRGDEDEELWQDEGADAQRVHVGGGAT